MLGRNHILTIAAVLLFALPAASAKQGRTVACFVIPKNNKQMQAAAVMSSIIREQMGKLVGITVRTGAPAGNEQAAIEAQRLADAGFTALNTGDKNTAVTTFQKAWDVLAQNPGVGNIRLHARVAKGLGVASFMTGKPTRGKELIKRSLLLFNKQTANEYAYTVDVRNIYEHAKREISEKAQGNIEVRSTPDGAEVYLDGKFKGYTPITLQNSAAGSHLVEVVKDGYLRWSTAAIVPAGGRIPIHSVLTASPVKGQLDQALARLRRNMRPKKFGKAVQPLLGVVSASEALVVMASVGQGGFQLEGFFVDLAGNVQPVKSKIAQDAQFFANIKGLLSNTLQAAFAAEGRSGDGLGGPPQEVVDTVMKQSDSLGGEVAIDPNSPLFNVEDKKKGDSITSKWWFWTIVGVGSAAIIGTVIGVALVDPDGTEAGAVGNLRITLEQFGN